MAESPLAKKIYPQNLHPMKARCQESLQLESVLYRKPTLTVSSISQKVDLTKVDPTKARFMKAQSQNVKRTRSRSHPVRLSDYRGR